jgi:hypothetical protein
MNKEGRELIRMPADDDFALTPKIWLALGLLSFNHQLLTLHPLQVLTPNEVRVGMNPERREAIRKGLAVLVDTERMTHDSRTAFIQIARHLLEPIGLLITQHGAPPLPPEGAHERHYIAVSDAGGTQAFHLAENPSPNPSSSTPERSQQSA